MVIMVNFIFGIFYHKKNLKTMPIKYLLPTPLPLLWQPQYFVLYISLAPNQIVTK